MITNFFKPLAATAPRPAVCARPATVVSLFDEHELSLKGWRERGYAVRADPIACLDETSLSALRQRLDGEDVAAVVANPPCKQLCQAGARWWAGKRRLDPDFQTREIEGLERLVSMLEETGMAFCILAPASGLVRRALGNCSVFHPCEYGEYAPAEHPVYAQIPGRDAYKKRSLARLGGGLRLPVRRPVDPVFVEFKTKSGSVLKRAPQFCKRKHTGARSVPPIGFCSALVLANAE